MCLRNYILLCIFISLSMYAEMATLEFFSKDFSYGPVPTERYVYQQLKSSPLYSSQITYVAAPWTTLINTRQLHKLTDIDTVVSNGFTVCQHIYYEKIIPFLKKIGVTTLFTPHASITKKYDGITVVGFPHAAVNGVRPAVVKDVWYSFIGCGWTHPVRSILLNMRHADNAVIKKREKWHWSNNSKNLEDLQAKEYQNVLARSRFSLCPRGTGPGTIRFWESLQAGAIPVVLSDDTMLPGGFNWDKAIVVIAEKDAQDVEYILQTISQEKEREMRKECLRACELFSGENFVRTIRLHFNEI